jgi:hypothetical protein
MAMARACSKAGINEAPEKKEGERWTPQEHAEFLAKRFSFHSFRKCVAKRWNKEKRPGHHALLGLGWSSPAMYIHYTRLGEYDIADEFGTSKKFAHRLPIGKKAESGGE